MKKRRTKRFYLLPPKYWADGLHCIMHFQKILIQLLFLYEHMIVFIDMPVCQFFCLIRTYFINIVEGIFIVECCSV